MCGEYGTEVHFAFSIDTRWRPENFFMIRLDRMPFRHTFQNK